MNIVPKMARIAELNANESCVNAIASDLVCFSWEILR